MNNKSAYVVPGWLLLIAAMTAVGPVSIDMYLPGFPLIERELGEHGVERTIASYLIGIALGQLFYGPLSDRFGRKPPMYVGFALYALGALGCALASSMPMLISMRVVQALGACSSLVIGRAIVRDRCEPEEAARAFATLMLIVALGPIIAPVLGGWVISAFGWRAVFAIQCALGVALLIAMHLILRESRDPKHVVALSMGNVSRTYGRLLLDRSFVGFSLAGGFAMGAMFCYVAGSPTVVIPLYDLSPQQFGWLISLNGLAFMGGSRLNILSLRSSAPTAVLQRLMWRQTLVGLLFVGLAMIARLPLWTLVALQFCFFSAGARVLPNVAALALAKYGREAGAASAMMGALQSGIATLAGVAVAAFNDGLRSLAMLVTIAAACSWLSYVWARRSS